MLSNHTVKTLEKQLTYVRSQVKGTTHPIAIKMINRELAELKAKLKEANNRNIVGRTDNGDVVYVADSQWKTVCEECLYIEGMPTGWDASTFDMPSGSKTKVTVDGGTNWTEVIVFN